MIDRGAERGWSDASHRLTRRLATAFYQLVLFGMLAVAAPFAVSSIAHAVEPDEILSDAALEARARKISADLRCLVCQNQSIDDSNAPLARDLRLLVRERLKQGETDAAVLGFIVQRYGEFVLLRPPFSWRTFLLWFSPVLILAIAIVVVRRRRREPVAPTSLTDEERQRLERILQGER